MPHKAGDLMRIKYTLTLYTVAIAAGLNTFIATLSKTIKIKPPHFYVSFQIFLLHDSTVYFSLYKPLVGGLHNGLSNSGYFNL